MSQATLCDVCEKPVPWTDAVSIETIGVPAPREDDPKAVLLQNWNLDICRSCASLPLIEILRRACVGLPVGFNSESPEVTVPTDAPGCSVADRFEGAPAPARPAELPGWEEIRGAIDAAIEAVADAEGQESMTCRGLKEIHVPIVSTQQGLIAALRPIFDRLIAAVAEARAGQAAAEAREGELREGLTAAREAVCNAWCSGGDDHRSYCTDISALLAAPAPEPSALLALIGRLKDGSMSVAGLVSEEVMLSKLRAAIGLPAAEEGSDAD